MSEPFRLRYVNQIVGAVLLIALVLLLALGLYVIRGRYIFARSVDYQVVIPQDMISGLRRGSDVVILGDVVGRVHRIAYAADDRKILLDLKIKEPFRDQILHDSQIQVRRKFGVGEPYLELMRGHDLLGVIMDEVPAETATKLGLDTPAGALVSSVVENGPAAQAGLRAGDVIVAMQEKPIRTPSDLAGIMPMLKPDETVDLTYCREDEPPTDITLLAKRSPSMPLPANRMLAFSDAEDTQITGVADQAGATLRDFQKLTNQSSEGVEKTMLPAFKDVSSASKSVQKTSDEFRPAAAETMQNVNDFLAYLQDEIDTLLVTINEVVDEDARPALQDLQATLQNMNNLMDEIGPKASSTLDELDGAGKSLNRTLLEVDDIVKILKDDLQYFPGTVPELRQVIRTADEVVTGLRDAPCMQRIIARGNRSKRRGCQRNRGPCNCNNCQGDNRGAMLFRRLRR